MTQQEMYRKLSSFRLPDSAAFVWIEFDDVDEGMMFEALCRKFGYKTVHHYNNRIFEVRFWKGFKRDVLAY